MQQIRGYIRFCCYNHVRNICISLMFNFGEQDDMILRSLCIICATLFRALLPLLFLVSLGRSRDMCCSGANDIRTNSRRNVA